MKESSEDKKKIREKIIGLGKNSIHKSYYPQLQAHVKKLEKQNNAFEEKNNELTLTLNELNETQKLLAHSEEKFRTLFENAQDAIFILDKNGIVTDFNPQALITFNTEKEHLINRSTTYLSAKIQPDGRKAKSAVDEHINLALKDIPQIVDWLFINPKEEHIYTRVSLNKIELYGKPFLQAIVRDITKEKQMEKDLLSATIKAEENERARFAKELHDGVGPILSTIKLYFQWLAETDNLEQKKIIIEKGNTNIAEAIKALKEVSNKLSPHILLNYGLIEGLKQYIEIVKETSKLKVTLTESTKTRLEQETETTLYRIITELINNTIKHAQASEIKISIEIDNKILKIKYIDNGKGIELDKMFEQKNGLGIYNMQNRLKNINGSINFDSKPNNGFQAKILLNLETKFER